MATGASDLHLSTRWKDWLGSLTTATGMTLISESRKRVLKLGQEMLAAAGTGHLVPVDVLDYLENRS